MMKFFLLTVEQSIFTTLKYFHSVWKSPKMSHFTIMRAKRATFIFIVTIFDFSRQKSKCSILVLFWWFSDTVMSSSFVLACQAIVCLKSYHNPLGYEKRKNGNIDLRFIFLLLLEFLYKNAQSMFNNFLDCQSTFYHVNFSDSWWWKVCFSWCKMEV